MLVLGFRAPSVARFAGLLMVNRSIGFRNRVFQNLQLQIKKSGFDIIFRIHGGLYHLPFSPCDQGKKDVELQNDR
jgi:uncharacterized protein YigE (DUF2233 family)